MYTEDLAALERASTTPGTAAASSAAAPVGRRGMSRTGLGRHGLIDDNAGDPLDGLVNLFDIGIVLAVAFLIAGLTLNLDPKNGDVQERAASAGTEQVLPDPAWPAQRQRARPTGRAGLPAPRRQAGLVKGDAGGRERRALRRRYSAETGRCSMPSSARAFWASLTVALRRPAGSSIGSS